MAEHEKSTFGHNYNLYIRASMMLRHMMELHDWSYVGLVRGYISIQTAHPFELFLTSKYISIRNV